MTCHCGRTLSPTHFEDIDDLSEQHKIRCCACVDSYLFGAPDCEECEKAGEASGDQAVWGDPE